MLLTRRAGLMGLGFAASFGKMAFALADAPTQKRLVVVLQRGAMDGMSVVVPYGDAHLAQLRPELIPPAPGQPGGMFDLGGFYGLSPNYAHLAAMYQAGEMLAVHAVAGPYRTRSHFEAQDLLQIGTSDGITSGWLNRALAEIPARNGPSLMGLAAGMGTPLLLQGAMPVDSFAPERFPEPSPDMMTRIAALNAQDPLLHAAITEGVRSARFDAQVVGNGVHMAQHSDEEMASAMEGPPGAMMSAGGRIMSDDRARVAGDAPKVKGGFPALTMEVGQLLGHVDGPRVAAFQLQGWDTHGNQVNGLKGVMTHLDEGLQSLKAGLGPAWAQTCVLVITEFGRTARMNGTRGTDHGTAATALVLGGAVKGGRVLADWPGLSDSQLYQNRDLAPTRDIRTVAMGVLAQHMGLDDAALARVFPGSSSVSPLGGMIRTA